MQSHILEKRIYSYHIVLFAFVALYLHIIFDFVSYFCNELTFLFSLKKSTFIQTARSAITILVY